MNGCVTRVLEISGKIFKFSAIPLACVGYTLMCAALGLVSAAVETENIELKLKEWRKQKEQSEKEAPGV